MRFVALITAALAFCLNALRAHAADTSSPVEVYVWGQQPTSAATEQTRWQRDLELRPSNTPSDVMRLTPGLIIGQHHGGGKALRTALAGTSPDASQAVLKNVPRKLKFEYAVEIRPNLARMLYPIVIVLALERPVAMINLAGDIGTQGGSFGR
jgi:hypothetical protein